MMFKNPFRKVLKSKKQIIKNDDARIVLNNELPDSYDPKKKDDYDKLARCRIERCSISQR